MQEHGVKQAAQEKISWRHLFSDRRIAAMLGLGFSSGIPFLLVYATQSAWLSEAKVPIGISESRMPEIGTSGSMAGVGQGHTTDEAG